VVTSANGYAWHEGMRRLEEAIAKGSNHVFETTLGGKSVTEKIPEAEKTHDVLIWSCGLSSRRKRLEEQHQDLVDLRERGDFRTAAILLKDHILGGRGVLLKEVRARQRIQEHAKR
jgi:hypothetical protein